MRDQFIVSPRRLQKKKIIKSIFNPLFSESVIVKCSECGICVCVILLCFFNAVNVLCLK